VACAAVCAVVTDSDTDSDINSDSDSNGHQCRGIESREQLEGTHYTLTALA
jgi:hypothetical protein